MRIFVRNILLLFLILNYIIAFAGDPAGNASSGDVKIDALKNIVVCKHSNLNDSKLKLYLHNLGTTDVSSLRVDYLIHGSTGGSLLLTDGISQGDSTSFSFDLSSLAEGNHKLSFYLNNNAIGFVDNNKFNDSVSINVNVVSPQGFQPMEDLVYCSGTPLQLTAPQGFMSYTWSNGSNAMSQTISHQGDYIVTMLDGNGCRLSDTINVKKSEYEFGLIQGQNSCQGDEVELINNHSYYNVQWPDGTVSSTFVTSAQGYIQYNIIDSFGCTFQDSVYLQVNPLPEITFSNASPSFCRGRDISLELVEEFEQIVWNEGHVNPTIEVSKPGYVNVSVVDENGCQSNDSIYVTELSLPVINLPDSDFVCNNEEMALDLDPGHNSYTWSTNDVTSSISVNQEGTYSVTIEGTNGCANNKSIVIENKEVLMSLGSDDTICKGGSISIGPADEYDSYEWSTGATTNILALGAGGDYILKVKKFGKCEVVDTINIVEVPQPSAEFTFSIGSTFNEIQFDNSSIGGSFQWSFGDNTTSSTENPIHIYEQEGSFNATLTVSNSCGRHSVTKPVNIINTVVINDLYSFDWSLHPNPTSGEVVHIQIDNIIGTNIQSIDLYNALGQLIQVVDLSGVGNSVISEDINVSNLSSGAYIVVLKSQQSFLDSKSFIVQ